MIGILRNVPPQEVARNLGVSIPTFYRWSPHPPHMSARVTAAGDLRGALSLTIPRDLRAMFDPLVVLDMPRAARAASLARLSRADDDHALMAAIGLIVR